MPWSVVSTLTPSGLIAVTVVMLLTGWLVPRRVLADSQARESRVYAAVEKLEEALARESAAHAETRRQLGELLIQGRVTAAILDGRGTGGGVTAGGGSTS